MENVMKVTYPCFENFFLSIDNGTVNFLCYGHLSIPSMQNDNWKHPTKIDIWPNTFSFKVEKLFALTTAPSLSFLYSGYSLQNLTNYIHVTPFRNDWMQVMCTRNHRPFGYSFVKTKVVSQEVMTSGIMVLFLFLHH